MRTLAGVTAAVLALSLAGCIQQKTIIKVKPDGSGTVEVTSTMNAAAVVQLRAQMKQMAESMGGDQKAQQSGEVFSEADAKAKAANMGEGVTFVKSEPVKTDKVEGLKAIYAFTDIAKLKLSTTPNKPNAPGMDAEPEEESEQISFKLDKQANGNALLTAVFVEKKKDPAEKKDEPKDAQLNEMMMMKQFFQGLRISIQVEPSTAVVQTNAPAKEGNVVTLMDLDFDQVMKDDANFKKFAATKDLSMMEAAPLLKDVPGIKMPATQEVTIEFSGK